MAVSALVEAGMLAGEMHEKFGHHDLLVVRARKVGREAAPGEVRRDLGVAYCSADASDRRTCETMAAG